MAKIAIIGAGNVGSQAAYFCAINNLGEVVLWNRTAGIAEGKALDLQEACAAADFNTKVNGSSNWSIIKKADLVVVTVGIPRKPGMDRGDLLKKNASILKSVCKNIKKYAPKSIVIIVTNPLDAMVWLAKKTLGFSKSRVMGMAGTLDTSRFIYFLADAAKVDPVDVHALVMGGHGDSMVPIVRTATIGGVPVADVLPKKKIDEIIKRTRVAGGEIVNYLKTGSAFYAPGAAIAEMCEAIVLDQKRVLPVSAFLSGEFNQKGIFVGVPVILGKKGIEKVVEFKLDKHERIAFSKTCAHVKQLIKTVKKLKF